MKFKQFLETMSQEGRDEYMAKYRVSGKTFEVWLRMTGPGSARITYLNSYGQGTGTMREALPELMADLKHCECRLEYGHGRQDARRIKRETLQSLQEPSESNYINEREILI